MSEHAAAAQEVLSPEIKTGIADLVNFDERAVAHSVDGKVISNKNLGLIAYHQGLIRMFPPSSASESSSYQEQEGEEEHTEAVNKNSETEGEKNSAVPSYYYDLLINKDKNDTEDKTDEIPPQAKDANDPRTDEYAWVAPINAKEEAGSPGRMARLKNLGSKVVGYVSDAPAYAGYGISMAAYKWGQLNEKSKHDKRTKGIIIAVGAVALLAGSYAIAKGASKEGAHSVSDAAKPLNLHHGAIKSLPHIKNHHHGMMARLPHPNSDHHSALGHPQDHIKESKYRHTGRKHGGGIVSHGVLHDKVRRHGRDMLLRPGHTIWGDERHIIATHHSHMSQQAIDARTNRDTYKTLRADSISYRQAHFLRSNSYYHIPRAVIENLLKPLKKK